MDFVCDFNFCYFSQGIEEGNLDMIDNSDLMDTDIPVEVPVPDQQFLPVTLSFASHCNECSSKQRCLEKHRLKLPSRAC